MKLFELEKLQQLPIKAGVATIEYIGSKYKPHRKDETITLPADRLNELYLIEDGTTFLFCRYGYNELWFGGTDERPFLVQLNNNLLISYATRGAEGLYDALRPQIIDDLEEKFEFPWRRQGDFFAVEMVGYQMEDLIRFHRLFQGEDPEITEYKEESLDGTRHLFTGMILSDILLGGRTYDISVGRLEAPDHRPLELTSPSILVQARGLYNPQQAD